VTEALRRSWTIQSNEEGGGMRARTFYSSTILSIVLVMPGCSASSQCKRDNITLTYSPPAPTPADTCFSSTFSYVCPEPALVKRSHLRVYVNG
jgi:hypothetical protein